MTLEERRVLNPLVRKLRSDNPHYWWNLKYQTQFGPEVVDFPYYPAALEFRSAAADAISELPAAEKRLLIEQRAQARVVELDTEDQILRQYSAILLDALVSSAKSAGGRTRDW